MKRALVLLLTVVSASGSVPALADGSALQLPLPVTKTLPNGARVAWLESSGVPVVDFVLLSDWGSRRDPAGKSGLANLGVAGWRSSAKPNASDQLGASRGIAFDGDQVTLNVEGFAADRSELLKDFLSVALRPDFDEADLRVQRDRIAGGWSAASESPDSLAQAFFERLALRSTPYWRGGLGGPGELKSITRADLVEWHRHVIDPSRVTVFGTGPGEAVKFFDEVEKFSAELGWKAADPADAAKSARLPADAKPGRGRAPAWLARFRDGSFAAAAGKQKKIESPLILLVDRPGAPQAHLRIGTRAPGFGDADRVPLSLANAALGETFDSRLGRDVRDQVGLVYGMASGFAWMREAALFGVSLATPPQIAGDALRRTLDVLARSASGDFTQSEIDEARAAGLGAYPLQFPSPFEIGMRWLATVVDGRDPRDILEFPGRVQAATLESVNNAVKKHWSAFAPAKAKVKSASPAWIVVAGDARVIRASLGKAGFSASSIVETRFDALDSLAR